MKTICCILFLYFISSTTSYTLTPSNFDIKLPFQKINEKNSKSFIRITENKTEIIQCPKGFKFDSKAMVCMMEDEKKLLRTETLLKPNLHCPDSNHSHDAYPYKDNCKNFLLCGPSGSALANCGGNLLFNPTKETCDYPLEAGCCEYDAKNPDVFWIQ